MSKNEKRYFKRFSLLHVIGKENNYIRLFDVISEMKKYDEEAALKQASFIKKESFADAKYQLYNILLRCLNHYHQSRNSDARMRTLLQSADILLSRNLPAQAMKVLRQAEKLGEEYEKYALLLEVISRQKKRAFQNFNLKATEKELERLNKRQEELIKILHGNRIFESLTEELYLLLSSAQAARSPQIIKRIEKIRSHPFLQKESLAVTRISRFNYHRAHSLIAYMQAEHESFYLHCKKIVEILEGTYLVKENPQGYFVALQNLLIGAKNTRRYDEVEFFLQRMEQYGKLYPKMQALVFSVSTDIRLTIFIDSSRFTEGITFINQVQKNVRAISDKISLSHLSLIHYNSAYIALAAGEYKLASRYINNLLNEKRIKEDKPDVYGIGLLLELIILYELSKLDLLETRLQGIARALNKSGNFYDIEKALLYFFRDLIREPSRENERKMLKPLIKKLELINKDPVKGRVFGFFDFPRWARAKVENTIMERLK
jgi:hypothetical protein